MNGEFEISADVFALKPCGDIHHAKYCRGRNQLPVLGSINVKRVADISHIGAWIYLGLVFAQLSSVSKIQEGRVGLFALSQPGFDWHTSDATFGLNA